MAKMRPIPVAVIGQVPRSYDIDAFLARHPEIVPAKVSYKDDTEDPTFSEDGEQHFEVMLGAFLGTDAAAAGACRFLSQHLAAFEEFSSGGGVVTAAFDCGGRALVEMAKAGATHMANARLEKIELRVSYSIGPRPYDEPEEAEAESPADSREESEGG